jgi:hypothetical protein
VFEKYWEGRKGGTLRRGWTAGKEMKSATAISSYAKSLPVYHNADNFTIVVKNPVEYASYVELGHIQEIGRFVPAIGKRLVNGWVEGRFMLKKSEANLESIMNGVLERKLAKKLKEVFSG